MLTRFNLFSMDDGVRWLTYGMLLSLPFAVGGVNLFGYLIILTVPFCRSWRQSLVRLAKNRLVVVSMMMLLIVLIGSWHAEGGHYEAMNVLNRYHKLLFIPLLMPFFQRVEHKKQALSLLFLALFVNVAISWTEYMNLTHLSDPIYATLEPGHLGDNVFRTHIAQGLLFDLLLVISGVYVLSTSGVVRVFYGLVGVLTGLNILIVMVGRTGKALLPVILMWLLVEWLWSRKALPKYRTSVMSIAILLGALVLGGTAWSVMNPSTMLGTVILEIKQSHATGELTSQGERVEFWHKGVELIRDNPWYGSGAGSVYAQTTKLANKEKTEVARMGTYNLHNEFLMWAVQFGIVGLFSVILFFIYYVTGPSGNDIPSKVLRGAGIVFLLGSLFNSLLVDFTEGYSMMLLAGILAYL